MNRKTRLLLAVAAGTGVLLAWQFLFLAPDQDPHACSASTERLMASFMPGTPYPDVIRQLQHMKLRYDAPTPLPDTVTDNPPVLYARVRETGFLVSRREDVRIGFDGARRLA